MELAAIVAVTLFTLIHNTCYHFQRFTLTVARRISYGSDSGMAPTYPVAALQNVMSPGWLGASEAAAWVIAVVSAYTGYLAYGWVWVIGLLVWGLFAFGFLDFVWPVPTFGQSLMMAKAEAARTLGGALRGGSEVQGNLAAKAIVELESLGARRQDAVSKASPPAPPAPTYSRPAIAERDAAEGFVIHVSAHVESAWPDIVRWLKPAGQDNGTGPQVEQQARLTLLAAVMSGELESVSVLFSATQAPRLYDQVLTACQSLPSGAYVLDTMLEYKNRHDRLLRLGTIPSPSTKLYFDFGMERVSADLGNQQDNEANTRAAAASTAFFLSYTSYWKKIYDGFRLVQDHQTESQADGQS